MADATAVAETPAASAAPMTPTSTFGQPRPVALRMLLEAGVHFGHQAKRWNPKMKRYIFTERNGIHIIDLQQTVYALEEAHRFVTDLTAHGGKVLFVGTKKQAADIIEQEATRAGQFYVNRRWMGGTLTNFVTIKSRLRVLKQLQGQVQRGEFDLLPKQEAAAKLHELEKLEKTLGGMRDMQQLPGAVFIVDTKREHLAVHEARRLRIPIIGLTDTNADPDDADIVIPANDDAIRALRLLTAGIADAAIEGQRRYEAAQAERQVERQSDGQRGGRGGRDQGAITVESFASAPAPRAQAAPAATPAPAPAEPAAPADTSATESSN